MKLTCLFTSLLMLISRLMFAGGITNSTSSVLKSVTVYRSGAEMVHTARATLSQGNNELTIEGVSNQVDISSIQVNCPSVVTILGVEFSNNYLAPEEKSPVIRILEDSIEDLQQEAGKINIHITTTEDLLDVLKTNRDIKGSQSGLSVAELMKLMDYYKNKSTELQNELALLKERQKKLTGVINKLKGQVAEEQKKNTKTSGRLVLQLTAAMAGKYDFTVSYISRNAYWTPYYDIRVDDIKNPSKIIYKAKVVQTTGIDWKQVKLSLSTSLPSQWGNAPVLNSWFLSYIDPVNALGKQLAATNTIQAFGMESSEKKEDMVRVRGMAAMKAKALGSPGDGKPLYVVNGAIMNPEDVEKINPLSIKNIEILKDASTTAIYGARAANGVVLMTLKSGLDDYVSVTDNDLNVTFDIDLPYDVPTNGKEQTATLKEFAMDALYKYYAVPKLDRDAYLLAEVSEWEKLNLLPGDANIIFEGTYVGKSFIDPNSTNDTLNLTLGRDKRVVIKREKLADYSSVKFLGSNKLQKITYEITLKNNKKDTVRLMLKDQFPLSTNKEIEVELLDAGGAVANTDIGVLTWRQELAPGESRKLRFSYSVKYPKDRQVNLN